MSCYAKAKVAGVAVDSNCLAKAEAKFTAAVSKAGSACAGTPSTVEQPVDDCVTNLLPDIPRDGKCPSASAKITGKSGSSLFGCQAKEVTKPGSFAACHASVDGKLALALAKASACVNSTNIHATLHDCLATLDGIIEPPPTTTTTTSSTTSTTIACQAVGGGFCWYLGATGADCNSTCAAAGKVYDPATGTFAGSGSSDANCTAVGSALSPGSPFIIDQNDTGWGCAVLLGGIFRDTAPTTATATAMSFARTRAWQ